MKSISALSFNLQMWTEHVVLIHSVATSCQNPGAHIAAERRLKRTTTKEAAAVPFFSFFFFTLRSLSIVHDNNTRSSYSNEIYFAINEKLTKFLSPLNDEELRDLSARLASSRL